MLCSYSFFIPIQIFLIFFSNSFFFLFRYAKVQLSNSAFVMSLINGCSTTTISCGYFFEEHHNNKEKLLNLVGISAFYLFSSVALIFYGSLARNQLSSTFLCLFYCLSLSYERAKFWKQVLPYLSGNVHVRDHRV